MTRGKSKKIVLAILGGGLLLKTLGMRSFWSDEEKDVDEFQGMSYRKRNEGKSEKVRTHGGFRRSSIMVVRTAW